MNDDAARKLRAVEQFYCKMMLISFKATYDGETSITDCAHLFMVEPEISSQLIGHYIQQQEGVKKQRMTAIYSRVLATALVL